MWQRIPHGTLPPVRKLSGWSSPLEVMPRDAGSGPACDSWFDLAHEWITQGFADVTSPTMHTDWGRTA